MSAALATRDFLFPAIGIVVLFAPLGPAIGGGLLVPLAVAFKSPTAFDAVALLGVVLLGHAVWLVAAYVVGIGPAAATGFVPALWDAATPARAPRALVATAIGGFATYWFADRLASLGARVELAADANLDFSASDLGPRFSSEIGVTLPQGSVACGPVASFVCALAARLVGLTAGTGLACKASADPPGGG